LKKLSYLRSNLWFWISKSLRHI